MTMMMMMMMMMYDDDDDDDDDVDNDNDDVEDEEEKQGEKKLRQKNELVNPWAIATEKRNSAKRIQANSAQLYNGQITLTNG